MNEGSEYAFPHSAVDESRRLQLLEQRLDPLTKRRVGQLGIGRGARCLEVGGGRGSIAKWLSELVGPDGHVTATDLETDFLDVVEAPNLEVVRHDVRTESFPDASFDLVHTRAVLMHLPDDPSLLPRMVSWLAPGGWLLLEEPDFGMWAGDADPVWASHPEATRSTIPSKSISKGRSLLREITQLDLVDIGADGEIDIIQAGTPLAEFYRLSMVALGPPAVRAQVLSPEQAAALVERPTQSDFLACGFVHIGVWGRRPGSA
ncbi:MAG TPA: class I SAM-dependent methyltransferase [Acidimicrobiales bacterium]|nr:class I SAM-dependent methyltransferase [Acidimicrobiales bacterium]